MTGLKKLCNEIVHLKKKKIEVNFSRDENLRERVDHREDGDRERDGQRNKSRDENSGERDHQRNEISNGKSKLNVKDKTGRIPWYQ